MTIGWYSKSYYVRFAILSYPALSCPALLCPVLSCPVLSDPTLLCSVFSLTIAHSKLSWLHIALHVTSSNYRSIEQRSKGLAFSPIQGATPQLLNCPWSPCWEPVWYHLKTSLLTRSQEQQERAEHQRKLSCIARSAADNTPHYSHDVDNNSFDIDVLFEIHFSCMTPSSILSLKLFLKSPLSDFPLSFPFPSFPFFSSSRSQTAFKHMRSVTTDMHLKSSSSYPLSREPT